MDGTKATKGVAWSAVERISTLGIQFVLNIIIARILSPSDYGLIGMLAIFLSISQCLIDSGFASALIQTKERKESDYGTVFIFNIFISVLLYLILFVSAPAIANFYNQEVLCKVLRVVGLILIITSLSNVHRTILTINVDFKTQSLVSIPGAIISGSVGLFMAYTGFGVWALVAQTLSNGLVMTLLFWMLTKERFKIVFDIMSFKRLGGFGIKLMFSGLLNTVYNNLYGLFIGKKYNAGNLGYYTRSDQLAVFPANTLTDIISRVAFPMLCQNQSDKNELSRVYTNFIKGSCFIVFPLMIGLSILSKPIIIVLLTEKWLPAAILMSILSLDGLWAPITRINLNLLQAVGRSDLFLRLEIVKKTISIGILLLTLNYGLFWICIGRFIYSIIALLINMYYTVSIIDKSYYEQFKDWFSNLLVALLMGACMAVAINLVQSPVFQLVAGVIIGMVTYYSFATIFKLDAKDKFFALVKKHIKHRR